MPEIKLLKARLVDLGIQWLRADENGGAGFGFSKLYDLREHDGTDALTAL